MTFEEKVKNMSLDYSDEWIFHEEEGTVSAMFNGLESFVYSFFDANEEDDCWINSYAIIDVAKEEVIALYFVLVEDHNESSEKDRDLEIRFTDPKKGKMFLDKLRDNGGEFDRFLADCKNKAA